MTILTHRLLNCHEVADWLGIYYRTVYQLRKAGELPAIPIGGSWRFDPADVQKYIDTQKEKSSNV